MEKSLALEQTAQIQKMEAYLDESYSVVREFSEVFEKFEKCQDKLKELSQYYGSEDWYRDLEDYDNGRLPKDLKCGVLSEDLIYNILMENRELAIKMLEVVTGIVKSN